MAKRRRGLARRILRGMLVAAVAWVGVTVAAVLAFRWVDPPFTMFMVSDRVGAFITREQGYEFQHDWVDWDRISKHAAVAVIASEEDVQRQQTRVQRLTRKAGFPFLKTIEELDYVERRVM